ncbi:MAG TPA: EamA family transporter [Thermoanaerobaculia bacterium]|nr:EamA family transporter [Thermoanaerobaculia bacterium]
MADLRPPSRALTYAALAALILIWGTTWAAIRVGLQGIPPLTGIALRFAIAATVLLALTPFFGVRLGREPRERRLWFLSALCNFCVSYGVIYWAEQWVPSGLSSVLFATYPLMTAALAHFALPGERLRPLALVGILTGFLGVALIFSEDFRALGGPRVAFAAGMMLLSPLSATFGTVSIKKWGQGIHPLSLSAVPMAITAVVMGSLAAVTETNRAFHWSPAAVMALLYLALFGSAFTFTVYFWLLKGLPVSKLSLFNYATPVVAVTVGSVFLDEPVTWKIIVGAGLVISGVVVAVRSKAK